MPAATDQDDELPLGAHLISQRRGYLHHGIYAGSGRVIHYAGFNRPLVRGPIEEVPIRQFAQGHDVRVKSWPAPAHTGEAAVARARSRLGEDRYRVWSNNCEHFANWCISGHSRSEQVEALSGRVRGLLRALVPVRRQASRERLALMRD